MATVLCPKCRNTYDRDSLERCPLDDYPVALMEEVEVEGGRELRARPTGPAVPLARALFAVTLAPAKLVVVPGQEGTCEVRVRNIGTIVDRYRFEVLGAVSRWCSLEPGTVDKGGSWSAVSPPSLNLLPETTGVLLLRLRPPRSSDVAAGPLPFGIRVISEEDPGAADVQEAVVDVAAFLEGDMTLKPQESSGRSSTFHDCSVRNRGNITAAVSVTAADANGQLAIQVDPGRALVEPGELAAFRAHIRPVKRLLVGAAQTHAFEAAARIEGEGGRLTSELRAPGRRVRRALVPSAVAKVFAVAIVPVVALVVLLWPTPGPTVEVPITAGMTKGNAQATLELRDLKVITVSTCFITSTPKDTAIRTDPKAGTKVAKGSKVKLDVSNGESCIKVINPPKS